jgi:hypothetical protein
MTTLTLTDAAGTPVNRSYPLVSSSPDLSTWKDYATNSGYPAGAGTATLSLKENQNGTIRLTGKLVLPTMESVAGDTGLGFTPPPTKAFDCIFSFDMVFPSRSSLQNRKDLKAMGLDFLGDALVTSAVESFVHPV